MQFQTMSSFPKPAWPPAPPPTPQKHGSKKSFPSQAENWNGEWFFSVEEIQLKDSVTGELIFAFTDDVISNFKLTPSAKGLELKFDCAQTNRSYTFKKPLTLSTDLELTVEPMGTDVVYTTNIKFKK